MTTRVSRPGLRYFLNIVFKTGVTCFRYHQHTCKGILRELNCPSLISRSSMVAVGVIGSIFMCQLDFPHESPGSSVLSTTEWVVPLVGGSEHTPVERSGHLWLQGERTTVVAPTSGWLWLAAETCHLGWMSFTMRPQGACLCVFETNLTFSARN